MDYNSNQVEQLINTMPGGMAKLAYDNVLTILYATDTFYSLIQNETEKVKPNTTIALLRTVYSADIIYVTQQLASQKSRRDNTISIHFRTLQQDGSFKWVLITGSRTNEVYQVGGKVVPIYSCIAMDITDLMIKHKKFEKKSEYQRTISELSKELYFEYEIATDTLTFAELFREVFGKDAQINGFRNKLEKTKLIHPDELPAVSKIFNSMMSGKKQVRFETRLIPKDGIPCWYTCYASIIFDENKNPHKLVGKLAVASLLKKEKVVSTPKPQLDSLTKVCTKESAENLINDTMEKQDAGALSALLLIDVRNYKAMNELMESVSGENILVKITNILKARFRVTDIIGRVNLSEFVVYVKDIQSDKIVYEKAESICKEVNELFTYQYSKSGISISIGITFHKGKQLQYPKLLANANAALVMAKKIDNSSFEVYFGSINS